MSQGYCEEPDFAHEINNDAAINLHNPHVHNPHEAAPDGEHGSSPAHNGPKVEEFIGMRHANLHMGKPPFMSLKSSFCILYAFFLADLWRKVMFTSRGAVAKVAAVTDENLTEAIKASENNTTL